MSKWVFKICSPYGTFVMLPEQRCWDDAWTLRRLKLHIRAPFLGLHLFGAFPVSATPPLHRGSDYRYAFMHIHDDAALGAKWGSESCSKTLWLIRCSAQESKYQLFDQLLHPLNYSCPSTCLTPTHYIFTGTNITISYIHIFSDFSDRTCTSFIFLLVTLQHKATVYQPHIGPQGTCILLCSI